MRAHRAFKVKKYRPKKWTLSNFHNTLCAVSILTHFYILYIFFLLLEIDTKLNSIIQIFKKQLAYQEALFTTLCGTLYGKRISSIILIKTLLEIDCCKHVYLLPFLLSKQTNDPVESS